MSIAVLLGCAVGPDYKTATVHVPSEYKEQSSSSVSWKAAAPNDEADRGKWWTSYQDPLLDQLEEKVTIDNQNLALYAAAYRQARAVVDEERAHLFPTVSLRADRESVGIPEILQPAVKKNVLASRSVVARGSWDLDVWGKVRRQVESDKAAAQASSAQLASMRLSAEAELATDYFELRYEDSLQRMLTETVSAYQRSLDITRRQYEAGAAAQSDVLSAETQVETTRAQCIAVGVSRAQYEHAIALLTGQAPADLSIPVEELTAAVPDIPVALPTTLLERRPDIAQAERQMKQQNALIGVAQAAFYPDISLSGLFGYAGSGSLISSSNKLWALGGSASQLLFDGGGRSAIVKSAGAAYDESVANYRQTVLAAFQNVEDALSGLRVLALEAEAQTSAVASSRRSVDIALREYQAGAVAYTTVVSAQGTALSNEQAALQVKESQLTESVALLKALGGGWNASLLAKQ
jgi:NodT family efflux transporter outer membrane factor (OMF) lipoprotein